MTQIFVLGLLAREPMSGYDIQTTLQEYDASQWGGILVGSIYYALKKLERDGCIEIADIEQTGLRQKAIYQITEAGKTCLNQLVLKSLGSLPSLYPSHLYAGLTFLDSCKSSEAQQALTQQLHALEAEKTKLEKWMRLKKAAFGNDLPPLVQLNFNHMSANLQNQIEFVRQIIEQILLPK